VRRRADLHEAPFGRVRELAEAYAPTWAVAGAAGGSLTRCGA
jgi:hypothetical protein